MILMLIYGCLSVDLGILLAYILFLGILMHLYDDHNSNRLVCYAMMGLVALFAFGIFAALPLVKGDEAWFSVPVLAIAALFIGYIQNRCTSMQE